MPAPDHDTMCDAHPINDGTAGTCTCPTTRPARNRERQLLTDEIVTQLRRDPTLAANPACLTAAVTAVTGTGPRR